MTFSFKQRAIAAAAAVIGLAVILITPIALHNRLSGALDDVKHARQATLAALDTASRESRIAAEARLQAQTAESLYTIAVARADSADRRAALARGSFAQAAKTAPDTCKTVVAAAENALAQQDSVAKDLRGALRSSQKAVSDLGVALDTTQVALRRLQGAAVPFAKAEIKLEKAAHPSIFARLVPRVGAGAAVGVDAWGKPNVVLGLTLGWSF